MQSIFSDLFPENLFIKIKINVLPTNSLNCQEYADNIWWPESGLRVAGERLRNRSFICEPLQCGVWKIYSHPCKSMRGWCVSLHSLRYMSAKGICLWFSYWMPVLFSTVCCTPLLLVTARLMGRERWQTKEYITYLYVSYVEGVTKLANTEMPLNFNMLFLRAFDSCYTTAQKNVRQSSGSEDCKYSHGD